MRVVNLPKVQKIKINFKILIERIKKIVGLKHNLEQFIPEGQYCYTPIGINGKDYLIRQCPFWDKRKHNTIHKGFSYIHKQCDGYCHYLKKGDNDMTMGLLWDQVKECGINNKIDLEDLLSRNKK